MCTEHFSYLFKMCKFSDHTNPISHTFADGFVLTVIFFALNHTLSSFPFSINVDSL